MDMALNLDHGGPWVCLVFVNLSDVSYLGDGHCPITLMDGHCPITLTSFHQQSQLVQLKGPSGHTFPTSGYCQYF